MAYRNRIGQVTATTGTGAITLGAAITDSTNGNLQALGAGDDGDTFDILIVDGSAWEIAVDCTYTHGTTSLTRGTLEESSTGAALNLSGSAKVYVTASAARLQDLADHLASTSNPHTVTAEQAFAESTAPVAIELSLPAGQASQQPMVKIVNTNDIACDTDDYCNEAHFGLVAQRDSATETDDTHRRYYRTGSEYNGGDLYWDWYFGANAVHEFILYSPLDSMHRWRFLASGKTAINSGAGATKVEINNGEGGTDGIQVYDGSTGTLFSVPGNANCSINGASVNNTGLTIHEKAKSLRGTYASGATIELVRTDADGAIVNNNTLGSVNFKGIDVSELTGCYVKAVASGTWSASATPTSFIVQLGNSGTATPADAFIVYSDGTISTKIDDLAAADDNTDLNASTTAHGLMPKLSGDGGLYFNGAGAQVQIASTQLSVSATDKILGRSSAGAGDIEEIACTAAGRALLDDTTAAAQRATLSAGYSIVVCAAATTLADATTYYWGLPNLASVTTATRNRIYIPRTGILKAAYVFAYCSAASTNENWEMLIRLNDTTDYSIATVGNTEVYKVWSNTGLSISVTAGDYIEMKTICPTWATEPGSVRLSGTLWIE